MMYSAKSPEQLQAAGENLLPAIGYGDAVGLPFEAKPAQAVGSITALPSIEHNEFLYIPEELRGSTGIWSDDTHLSLASTIGLVQARGADMAVQADMLKTAYQHVQGDSWFCSLVPPIVTEKRNNGFGGSTVNSITRLMNGVDYNESGEVGGAGNGVLMRMAPLTYYQYVANLNGDESGAQLNVFTNMTHNSYVARTCSAVHKLVLMGLLGSNPASPDAARQRRALYRDAIHLAELYEPGMPKNGVVATLERIEDGLIDGNPQPLDRDQLLARVEGKKGGGFYAPETLMMAYGSFLIEPHFPDCVYRAAELGGDSDSIASIVGAMAAFYWGELEFPDDVEQIFAIDRLRHFSKHLSVFVETEGR